MVGHDELFFFFAPVILAAPSVSVSNSIFKFADLLILIFMEIVDFSAPISPCVSALFLQGLCPCVEVVLEWRTDYAYGKERVLYNLSRP